MWFAVFVKTYDDNIETQHLKMFKHKTMKMIPVFVIKAMKRLSTNEWCLNKAKK